MATEDFEDDIDIDDDVLADADDADVADDVPDDVADTDDDTDDDGDDVVTDDDDDDEEEDEEASLDVLLRGEGDDDTVRGIDPRDDLAKTPVTVGEGEFTCRSCFLVKRRAQLADADRLICLDCD